MEIEEKVNGIIHKVLKKHGVGIDMITPEKQILDDLNAESLDVIEMMLAFQEEFDVSIDEEVIGEIRSVEDIYGCVRTALATNLN